MTRPVIGVIGNTRFVENRISAQQVGENNLRAIAEVAGALPLMFAGNPKLTDIPDLLASVDGVLLTGARANVHPSHFNTAPDPKHEPYDEDRDAVALPLIAACVAQGLPVLGICRGFQEMNVAAGGSLHPEIRELPGRMNHRMPRLENGEIHPDMEVVFADRHDVRLVPDGVFALRFWSGYNPGKLASRTRHPRARRARRRRGNCRGWYDRGDPVQRCPGFCARRAMACRIRPRKPIP